MTNQSFAWEPYRGKTPYAVQIVYFSFLCLILFFTIATAVCIISPKHALWVLPLTLLFILAGIACFVLYHRGRHHTYLLWNQELYRVRYVKRIPETSRKGEPFLSSPVDILGTLKCVSSEADTLKILKTSRIKDTPRQLIVRAQVLHLNTQNLQWKTLYIKNCYRDCAGLYHAICQLPRD